MGRAKRGAKSRKKVESDEDSDVADEPNPESEDFFKDDVGKFHSNREKILLDTEQDEEEASGSDEDEEEVMGLDLQDSDEEESENSDDEDNDDDDGDNDDDDGDNDDEGLPSDKAWGKKKVSYYDADVVDADIDVAADSDEEAWALEEEEEQEALALQKRMASALDELDFDIVESVAVDEDEDTNTEKDQKTVAMDLTKLTKEQKLEILSRESPELFELLDELKFKLKEVVDRLNPLVQLTRQGKIPIEGAKYIELKHKLYLNYCINIAFYLRLKSQQTPVKDHPVIARIVQYRTLIKELEPIDSRLEAAITALLASKDETEVTETEKATEIVERKGKKTRKTKQKLSSLLDDSDENEDQTTSQSQPEKKSKKRKHKPADETPDPMAYYEEVRMKKRKAKEMKEMAARLAHEPAYEDNTLEEEEGGKRAITYKISKNKGLTARKKKQERNPRVKHKKKYTKALIKRKSQVRAVVNEQTRYGGEATGIRAQLSRSVKIK